MYRGFSNAECSLAKMGLLYEVVLRYDGGSAINKKRKRNLIVFTKNFFSFTVKVESIVDLSDILLVLAPGSPHKAAEHETANDNGGRNDDPHDHGHVGGGILLRRLWQR